MLKKALAVAAACFLTAAAYSQTITTGTISPTTYCAGASITVPFNVVGTMNSGNVYTAEISNQFGAYVGNVLGTLTSSSSGNLSITGQVPYSLVTSNTYRVRVTSSSPTAGLIVQSPTTLTVNAIGINAPSFAGTTFCQGASLTVPFTVNSNCPFPNTPSSNVFTAELSDNFGNFGSPTPIGSLTSAGGSGTFNISTTIPVNTPGGNGYRIRITSSNPGSGLVSPLNSSGNITINSIGMNSPTHAATTYCAGATFSLTNVFITSCNFLSGNQFTAQLSDANGSFASPTNIGSSAVNQTTANSFNVTIPTSTPAGTGYRIQIVSTNPVRTSQPSANDITINQFGIDAPTVSTTSLCQGAAMTITYTIQNSCNFPNTPSANVFTAQLSNASGSFASPVNIGTVTRTNGGTINATIPANTPAGSGYRVRVVSSNPTVVVGAANTSDISVTATSGTPTVYGTTAWNAYVYSGTNATITSNAYLGTYTENNLSFASTSRWAGANGPGTADNSSGNAYSGCAVGTTNYSISYKRTNFTCGYYQIDLPAHDDDVRLFIDGTNVFQHIGCCDSHTNVWSGFLGPSSQVDVQVINFGGPGNLSVTVGAGVNPLTVSPATTICSTQSATLTVSSPLTLSYTWSPATGLSGTTGASVTASPASTTTYTVTGTDATTNCTVSKTVTVTVVSTTTNPTLTVTNTIPTICSGITASTLTVSGANTYTWSPAAGLSSTTGNTIIANPATTTTYTVTGSTGCRTATATTTVTVQNVPSSPAATTFGNNVWNVYAYNDMTFTTYYGLYTENNLSFNTASRWATNAGPSAANNTSGSAYSGCTVSTTNNSVSFKRTNFACGYYQMTINNQDDRVTMFVNGTQVFQNNAATGTVQTNVWSGFLNSSSNVELQLINTGGPGRLDITFGIVSGPQVLGPDVVLCPGNSTPLTSSATAYPGATYQWSISPTHPTITFTNANAANTDLNTTAATPSNTYTVTNTMTDAGGTGCTATRTETITVNAVPNPVITPSSATIVCPTQVITLTASGGNTYTWSPTTGLTIPPGPGNIVQAQPTATTTYTVTADNGCATRTATVTVTVVPLPDYNTFPTNVWNFYGFNSQTVGTNYQGYYTDNGTGPNNYNFNSGTRWNQNSAPSTTTATNGAAWQGCPMPTSNYSLSAKRTGFLCGTYTIDIPAHDDNVTILVNGVQVAQHNGCCDAHTAMWTGVLTTTSTVEIQMIQGSGTAYIAANLNRTAPSAGVSIWVGTTNTDWFTASNWCNTIPTSTIDVIIPAGAPNYPTIGASGAQSRTVNISAPVAATGFSAAVPSGSLTMGAFNLDVNGNWVNNGTFNAGAGTVTFLGGTSAGSIAGATTFNNLVMNKANGLTISSGTTQLVTGAMTLTNGIISQSGTFRFMPGSSVTGASNASHFVGVVQKEGNTAFTFPVGRAGLYRPASISAPSAITDRYGVQYLNSSILGSFPNSSRAITLDHVSNSEWWQINRLVGTSAVNVGLSWDSNSGGVGDPSSLRVTGWNGSLWTDLGNGGTTGTAAQGTITASNTSTSSGAYTLASTTWYNALPVTLTNLRCGVNDFGNPEIEWNTEVEINSDYFGVERSFDGRSFDMIGRVTSKGDSKSLQRYSFEDLDAPNGKSYYRLKQVDRDTRTTYYEVCAIDVESAGLSVSPNPTSNKATIKLGGALTGLTVVNSVGQKVPVDYLIRNSNIELDMSSLAPGVYIVRVSTANKSGVLKIVKQ